MENLPPHVLRLVYKEVSALAADPPEGIKIYPSEEDITELHTAIEGPGKDCGIVLVDLVVQENRKAQIVLFQKFLLNVITDQAMPYLFLFIYF